MSICAPYAVAALCGDSTLEQAFADFRACGWIEANGASLTRIADVLRLRGFRVRQWIGTALPARGIALVAGSSSHAIGIDLGQVLDIQDRSLPSVLDWQDMHSKRYPRVFGGVEIVSSKV